MLKEVYFNAKDFLAIWVVKQGFVSREKGDIMVSFYQIQDLGITYICREEGATSSNFFTEEGRELFGRQDRSFGLVTSAELAKNGKAKGMTYQFIF